MTQALAEYSSPDPSLQEVLAQHVDGVLADLHTAMPGIVQTYHADTQTVDVLCAFQRVYKGDPTAYPYPVLMNVPLWQFNAGGAWVKLPIGPGDEVLLIFCERALTVWWTNGGSAAPDDTRKFSLGDAVAIPGISSKGKIIQPKGQPDSLEIQNGGLWMELTNAGQVKLGNGTQDIMQALFTFATTASTATTAPQIAAAAATLLTTLTALVDMT